MKQLITKPFLLICISALALAGCATDQQRSSHASLAAIKTDLAPLPETVTSFGAVTSDGWLYAFGGHKGERHEYNKEMVSGSFQRLDLSKGGAWGSLPSSTPSQGLPLVAHDGKIYRIGGMAARNHTGTKQDLYSVKVAQVFDPKIGQWQDIAPLPAARSSHDAVVLGDRIYVAGGWQLDGGTNKPVWPKNALVLDLKKPEAGWKEFSQPFQRRALALAKSGNKIFCLGGMDSDNEPTLAVDVYDTKTGEWSKGPQLPPGKFKGFGCSAIAQNGHIYANTFQGDLLRLSSDEKSWEIVGHVEHPRLAHRLVATGGNQLIVLGGEDGDSKRPDLEVLTPSKTPLAPKAESKTASASTH